VHTPPPPPPNFLMLPTPLVDSKKSRGNLVPRAWDPREGTWGSGIIHFREESDWALIWNAQFSLSQDSWLPATDYPRASRSFPRIAGSGNEIDPEVSSFDHWAIAIYIGFDNRLVMGDTSFFGFDTIPVRYHEFWSIPIPKSIPILIFFHLLK
jgi:hypothetical protein